MSKRQTHLYRLWNSNGELIYVGISKSAVRRLTDHQRGKAWADEIASVTIQVCATRAEAEALEVAAIKGERPKYNIKHKHQPTPMERIAEDWVSLTLREREDCLRQAKALAAELSRLAGNTQKDVNMCGLLSLWATTQDPHSDVVTLDPTKATP